MRRPLLTLLGAAAFALGACSSGATPSTAPASQAASSAPAPASQAPAAGGSSAVEIKNFAFNPATITVAKGTKVTWTNSDSAPHTVTFDQGSDTSDNLSTGSTFDETFASAGTFTYHCKIHPNMKGTVTVTG